MRDIAIIDEKRLGKEHFKSFDMAKYARMNFGMFGGEETTVHLAFKNDLVGVIIDRFGKEITIRPYDQEGWSETRVEVAVSDQFLGWIFALGSNVKITGPDEVVDKMRREIKQLSDLYK